MGYSTFIFSLGTAIDVTHLSLGNQDIGISSTGVPILAYMEKDSGFLQLNEGLVTKGHFQERQGHYGGSWS